MKVKVHSLKYGDRKFLIKELSRWVRALGSNVVIEAMSQCMDAERGELVVTIIYRRIS